MAAVRYLGILKNALQKIRLFPLGP